CNPAWSTSTPPRSVSFSLGIPFSSASFCLMRARVSSMRLSMVSLFFTHFSYYGSYGGLSPTSLLAFEVGFRLFALEDGLGMREQLTQYSSPLAPECKRAVVKLAQPGKRALVWPAQPLEKVKHGSLVIAQAGRVGFGNVDKREQVTCHRDPRHFF